MTDFKKTYQKLIPELEKTLGVKNPMAVPKILKIVINVGLKEALTDKKVIEVFSGQLALITGQKPAVTKAKKSISAFKLRAGDKIGLKVTLRGRRMYDFFERLVSIVLPRVRDFHGVLRESFDDQGNFSLGLKEQIVFPEIDPATIDKIRGLEITIVTTAKNAKEGTILLEKLGMPFAHAQGKPIESKKLVLTTEGRKDG